MSQPAHSPLRSTKAIPGATYRVQFHRGFTFQQATNILDYLSELGITDVYASPLFTAGPTSTHGYDICCFGTINPNIGTETEFERFNSKRRQLGLGLLLDMVPNHMAVTHANSWWLDVLENGPESNYAAFFDIHWQPENLVMKNKVLLPVLGNHYATVLASGQLKLGCAAGKFFIAYHDQKFPVSAESLPQNTGATDADAKEILGRFNGQPGQPRTFDRLHDLIQQQHYRLAYWRVGSEEINYRRFFDVTELVSLRMELPEVFAASHKLVFEWLKAGQITGLRIDHPDGLLDPKEYFERLQSKAAELAGIPRSQSVPVNQRDETSTSPEQCLKPGAPLYVVAEKILSGNEALPDDWAVDGTTGYDFLNRVNGLFVNGANEKALDEIYHAFIDGGSKAPGFHSIVLRSKKQILETSLISELDSLTHRLQAVGIRARTGMDFTFSQLKSALKDFIAAFPVYRTYLTEQTLQPSPAERAVIKKAVTEAQANAVAPDPAIFQFLGQLLTLELLPELETDAAQSAREFILRFQQLTGPVMAKGLEDTAFYNFNRLISLNEVGGDPGRFGVSVEAFHNANATIAAHWPHTLLATATHDTKRGEDARARINVLSEMPDEWRTAVARWREWNANRKISANDAPAPTPNDEYLLYQSLVGALPVDADEPDTLVGFRDRVTTFMLKAAREAKANTSWLEPNGPYETAIHEFTAAVLAENPDNLFLNDLKTFARRVAYFGKFNSLAQTLLKITSPGVPDFYQGTELWDLSFVDPDNRRPVNFALRQQWLSELKAESSTQPVEKFGAELLKSGRGKLKLFLIWRALTLRNRFRDVFEHGTYTPLSVFGARKDHVCGFTRTLGNVSVLTVVPRLVCSLTNGEEIPPLGLSIWQDTVLALPESHVGRSFRNSFTHETVPVRERDGIPHLRLADVLKTFPAALLEPIAVPG